MRLYELFEADSSGLPPGTEGVLNLPPQKPGVTSAVPAAPNGVPATNNANVAAGIGTNGTAVTPAPGATGVPTLTPAQAAAANQKLSKGSILNAPVGPSKKVTPLKITNVAQDKDKTVTLTDPQKPTQPGMAYKFADLANLVTMPDTQ